jgi:N6-adenosine-specific RNA methylase IME4
MVGNINTSEINLTDSVQPRAENYQHIIESYAELMESGIEFPPIVVFQNGQPESGYWLADGFHRTQAAILIERSEIKADIRSGDKEDAAWYAYGANKQHGMQMNHADKQRNVKLALAHPHTITENLSDRAIANHVGVDHKTVAKYREGLTGEIPQSDTRKGLDGRVINTRNIGAKVEPGLLAMLKDTAIIEKPSQIKQLESLDAETQTAVVEKIVNGESSSIGDAVRQIQREDTKALANVTESPTGKYRTIVIDPPWAASDSADNDAIGRSQPNYSTMTLEEIAALPVEELAFDDGCHLYLWARNRTVKDSFQLIEDWGFRYITMLTWCKPDIGLGLYFRNNTEPVLFAVRGSRLLARADVGTWFEADRSKHSAKPETFFEIVESCSAGPRLEMFAREDREGWHTWGAEV